MKLTLKRFEFSPSETIGQLYIDGEEFCFILERAWMDNKPEVSCIPLGKYICKRVNSPKYGNTFEVTGVEGRTDILFHYGNFWYNSLGCLICGTDVGYIDGVRAVLNSRRAFNNFIGRTDEVNEFELEIIV